METILTKHLDVERSWSKELGMTVEIFVCSGYYALYVGGQACYTNETLDEIERWLGIYSMVKGET